MGDNDNIAYTENTIQKKKGIPMWFIMVFVPLLSIMIVLILVPLTQKSPILDIIKDETNPVEVYEKTDGALVTKSRINETFDEYFERIKDGKEDPNLVESDYSINSPLLEYDYSFYEGRREFYDRCSSKEILLNFKGSKVSSFSFNYLDKTFEYKVNLYPDLYVFSDKLKTQDCYFDEGRYTEGFLDDPYNNNFVKSIADDFINLRNEGYTDDQIVEIATLFVQSIDYGTDKTQLNRYAYETIYEGEGNCLDKSVILVGILKELGYSTYFILGQSEQYHALVGIECNRGNIIYEGKNICFAETTVYTPIGSNVSIEIENLVPTSKGNKVYNGNSYGPFLVTYFKQEHNRREQIEAQIDTLEFELNLIEEDMCKTDCVFCRGNEVDFERSKEEIDSCFDASEYNELVLDYNDNIEEYNRLIKNWYEIYYDLENSMFNNVKLLNTP